MASPLRIVYIAAHGGYHPERLPLGGGASVCRRLVHLWAADRKISLTLLAPGRRPPDTPPAVKYVRLPVLGDDDHPARLSRREYARFCRRFEAAATDHLRAMTARPPPEPFVVLSNDISEGVDFRAVTAMGHPIVTIFHVDVAHFFSRMYLRLNASPAIPIGIHRALASSGLSALCPDVLRLVFEKQSRCVRHSSRLVVPSDGMARTLRRCYGLRALRKTTVLPWGGWDEDVAEREVGEEMDAARRDYDLRPDTPVLLTLSRISPEKGLDRLLKALLLWERDATAAGLEDVRVLICGGAAFMGGEAYAAVLRKTAARLRRIRVQFPGHVGGARKRALFRLADLYVSPSRHESYGLTIVEALRQGVPVVSSVSSGSRDLVQPAYGKEVELQGRGGEKRLLKVLQEILSDRGALASMGAAAHRAGREMDFSTSATALRDLLASTLA